MPRIFAILLAFLGIDAAAAQTPAASDKAGPAKSVEIFRGSSTKAGASPDVLAGGYTTVIELAPLLVAADRYNAGGGVVRNAAIPVLLAGELDVATNAETQALRFSVKRPDLRIIMTVAEGHYRILGRRSRGIARLEDLRGKRIATMKDSSANYFLHNLLQSVGMSEADITLVPLFPVDKMTPALTAGEVDAIAVWEPEVEKAKLAIGADAVEFEGRHVYRELFNLNTTAAVLDDPAKRRQVVAYVRDLLAASEDMRRDPAMAQRLSAAASGHGDAMTRASWPHIDFKAGLAPDLLDVMETEEVWLAASEGRAPRARDELSKLIDRSVIDDAMSLPVPPAH